MNDELWRPDAAAALVRRGGDAVSGDTSSGDTGPSPRQRAPLPPAGCSDWAYFLDFDGTLVDIAETPDAVRVPPALTGTLAALADASAGAVALVTGRAIADLDDLLRPLRLPAAGLHGGELRAAADGPVARAAVRSLDAEERGALAALGLRHRGIIVEDKGAAVALHYRRAPDAAADCVGLAERLAAAAPDRRRVQRGKMVAELKLMPGDKGEVVRRLMQRAPFAGRRPVFLGDDLTDEDGFAACLAMGGLAIRVGADDRATRAPHGLPSPAAAIAWLAGAAATVAGR